MTDRVFISHAGRDLSWADWVSAELRAEGYDVELAAWDWDAGDNFILRMNDALAMADRVVALLSASYFDLERFTTVEWTAVMADRTRPHRLVPLRVGPVELPPLFRPLVVHDLYGRDATNARGVLLRAVRGGPGETGMVPADPPPAAGPAGVASRPPGALPELWNVPVESATFKGRDGDLVDLRGQLLAQRRVAIHGIGGVGKTALAIHYAHQFASEYDLVWWIDAERPALIAEQLAALAVAAGLATVQSDAPTAAEAARRHLQARARWLLVLDNAEQADDIRPWLPEGLGHVLITSRSSAWRAVATPMAVDVLTSHESATLLCALQPELSEVDARRLAESLGYLPLALAQAGGVLADNGMPAAEYLEALDEAPQFGQAAGYPHTLATTVQLSVQRLTERDPAAVQLLELCAFLASEPIPLRFFATVDPALLPRALGIVNHNSFRLRLSAGNIARCGLGTLVGEVGVVVHRMTQTALRGQMRGELAAVRREQVERMLTALAPADTDVPSTWDQWAVLVPHLLAIDPAGVTHVPFRAVVCQMVRYLLVRGDVATVLPIANGVYIAWARQFGPDDPDVLAAANRLAHTYNNMGRHDEARDLCGDTLVRCERVLGPDHPETLRAANGLARAMRELGQVAAARDRFRQTLERQQRVLGADHPETLRTANGLASALRSVGRVEEARAMFEDTLARCRRSLGEEHLETLRSAASLSYTLYGLGQAEQARSICAEVLERCQRVLGPNHPDTLRTANNLGFALKGTGDVERARQVCEDAYARCQRVWGEDHPEALALANNLANALRELGRLEPARQLCEETVEHCMRTLGEDHPETLRSTNNLAGVVRDLGRNQEARRLFEETHARRVRVLGEDHPETLRSRNSLAAALLAAGAVDRSIALYQDTRARCLRVLGERHPETLRSATGLANALRAQGEPELAREIAAATLAQSRELFGDRNPYTLLAEREYAVALVGVGEVDAARVLARDCLARCREVLGPEHVETQRVADLVALLGGDDQGTTTGIRS